MTTQRELLSAENARETAGSRQEGPALSARRLGPPSQVRATAWARCSRCSRWLALGAPRCGWCGRRVRREGGGARGGAPA